MKPFIAVLACLLLSCPGFSQSIAPQVFASGGNVTNGPNFQLDWTLGENLVSTRSPANLQLTEGFHQSRYFLTALSPQLSELQIEAFPNPSQDHFNLSFTQALQQEAKVELISLQGQILQRFSLHIGQASLIIPGADLPSGIYFLRLISPNFQSSIQIRKTN